MSVLARFNPEYLSKLSEQQRSFIETGTGVKFVNEFIFRHGEHVYVIGRTGGGKTQKGYWLLDWLKHTENIIWISTGKSNEILPLFCMGKKVRIIIPKGSEFNIDKHLGKGIYGPIDNPPEIVQIGSAREAWWAIHTPDRDKNGHPLYNWINIFEFRNTITESEGTRSKWMSSLFETLAEWTREQTMPAIFPCSIFADESQWILAGSRISTDHTRVKTSEIVTENALEIRSAGGRLILFAQDYKNVTPASRENMTCTILCRGAQVDRAENNGLSIHCNTKMGLPPSRYKPSMGKFIYPDNSAFPQYYPWDFPLFPKDEPDRDWIANVRIRYGKKYGKNNQEDEREEECLPELGRFSAMAIKPEEQEAIISRWQSEGVTAYED